MTIGIDARCWAGNPLDCINLKKPGIILQGVLNPFCDFHSFLNRHYAFALKKIFLQRMRCRSQALAWSTAMDRASMAMMTVDAWA